MSPVAETGSGGGVATDITSVIDVVKMIAATVTIIGAGGAAELIVALARCGVGTFILIDFDLVTAANIARQGHHVDEVGCLKIEAVAAMIRRINPDARIICLPRNFLEMTAEEVDAQLGQTDLFIFATDHFPAQARGNEVALRLRKPAIWIGLYAGGLAGEIVWWAPHIAACFRCLCSKRYAAHAKAAEAGQSLDPPSDGCTIFDVSLLDSIEATQRQMQWEKQQQERRRAAAEMQQAARLMQLALLQFGESPDFRRAATFAKHAKSVPVAFRIRQFRRFRPFMVEHLAARLRQGRSTDELLPGLTELVTALGMAAYEADYIRIEAEGQTQPATQPQPGYVAQVRQLQAEHDQRLDALRNLPGIESDLREQLIENEQQRFRERMLTLANPAGDQTAT